MKSAFEHRMKKFVRHTYEGWNFSLETLMPKEYVEHYLVDGVLKELRMIKYGIPRIFLSEMGYAEMMRPCMKNGSSIILWVFLKRAPIRSGRSLRGQRSFM